MDLLATIASWLHMAPSTFLALIVLVGTIANVVSRLIPNDATGALGIVRQIASFIGVNVSSRITSGVTIADTAKATLSFPEVAAKVDDAKKA